MSGTADSHAPLSSFLPFETRTSFPISDGRELVCSRGVVRCLVWFEMGAKHTYPDESDWVIARLAVAASDGSGFCLERKLEPRVFFELLRTSRSHSPNRPEVILAGIHCAYDHRDYVPTAAVAGDRIVALGYHTKYLSVDIDLLAFRARHDSFDDLAIRVPTLEGSGLAGSTPEICVVTDWAAKVIVWPGLVLGGRTPYGEQPVFKPSLAQLVSQELVQVR